MKIDVLSILGAFLYYLIGEIQNMIEGVNPSITDLIYYLGCWGIIPTDSNAGFYPGDLEEQEYHIQNYIECEHGELDVSGSFVMIGVINQGLYVYMLIDLFLIKKFTDLLPEKWSLKQTDRNTVFEGYKLVKLILNDSKLDKFHQIQNSIFEKTCEKYNIEEEEFYCQIINRVEEQSNFINEINLYFEELLPLSISEYTDIRNKAINNLVEKINMSIQQFSISDIKYRVDNSIIHIEWLLKKEKLSELAILDNETNMDHINHIKNTILNMDGYISRTVKRQNEIRESLN